MADFKPVDLLSERDKNILRYQFAINFMSKRPDDLGAFIEKEFDLLSNAEYFINTHLLPTLLHKSKSFHARDSKLE